MKKTFILTLFMMLCSLAFAQNAGQNSYDWGEFNYHNYPTTEHVFATLTLDGEAAGNIQNYEIAPFCGTELRGDAVKALDVNGKYVFWFSVYGGNAEEPETITFKLYDYATGTLFDNVSETTVTYGNNNGVNIGSYAEPIVINFNHVAEVADVKYGSLAKAVEVAAAGQTVKVINDVVLAKGLVVEKNLTFDLNGKAITATEGVYPVIRIQNEANVTVTGNGSITNATDYVFVLGDTNIATSGYLTIENGTFLGGTSVASVTKGNLTINGGEFSVNPYQGTVYTYLINCYDASYKNGTATVAIKGGTFYNWNPENNAAEGEGTNFCPQTPVRYIAVEDPANTFTVKEGAWIAQIEDGTKFQTLAAAVKAAPVGTTVTLLESATGAGVEIDRDVTINFGGFTYTFNEGVGSKGTTTLGFQILKDSNVTLKNGTLTSTAVTEGKEVKVLVQNYANLTLKDMNLVDNTDYIQYALSNNSGNVSIEGNTNITTDAVAFDVYDYTSAGYTVPTVNVTTTGIITGAIEVSESINGNLNISSGKFTAEIKEAWCAEGYIPTGLVNGYYSVKEGAYVARNMTTGQGYETLPAAVDAAAAGNIINLLADVTLTSRYTITKAVTIDGDGHSIIADNNFAKDFLISVNSSNVTLKNVVLNSNNSKSKNINVYCAQNVVFDNVSIINATGGYAALTVNGSTLTTKTSFKALGNAIAIDIDNGSGVTSAFGLTVEEGTVYDLGNKTVKFASKAVNDVTGAVDAEGNPYFAAMDNAYFYTNAQINSRITAYSNGLTLLADVTVNSSSFEVKGTLGLNGNDLVIAEGKKMKVSAKTIIKDFGSVEGEIVLTNASATLTAPEGLDVTTSVENHIVYYKDGVYSSVLPVAETGGKPYATLADAVEAAEADKTVTVLRDATSASVVIDKKLTIDLNGKAITAAENVYPVIRIQNGANVTVTGEGSITNATDYVFVLGASDKTSAGYLTIENGTFLGGTTVASVTKGNLTINGGDFSVNPYQGNYAYLINCFDASYKNGTATVAITGGTFHNWNPENNAAEGEGTNFCPKGYKAFEGENETYTVSVILPEVDVTNIKETLTDEDPDLTFALNFAIKDIDKLTESYLEDLFDKYGKHYVDYVLTIEGMNGENGTVTFNANGGANGYLAGQYDGWSENWVTVPFENVVVKNGESFYIMEYAAKLMDKPGLRFTLAEIAEIVQNFDCGVYFTNEFLVANPNLKVTLELKVFTEENGVKVDNIDVAKNVFEVSGIEAIVSATGKQTQYCAKLATAIETASAGATVTLLRNVESSDIIAINKDLTIDLSGKTVEGKSNRLFRITETAEVTAAKVTIENGTIKNNVSGGRCIETRTGDVTLNLNKVELIAETGASQPLTVGGSGENIAVKVTSSTISAGTGYGITTFNPAVVTLDDTEVTGYSALNIKVASSSLGSAGSVFNIENGSVLVGINNAAEGETNSFCVVMVEDKNITINVKDSELKAVATNNPQSIFGIGNEISNTAVTGLEVNVDEETTLILVGEKAVILGLNDDQVLGDNLIIVPDAYKDQLNAEAWATIPAGEGFVQVCEAVASVNETYYATLQAAVDAADGDDDVVVLVADATGSGVVINKNVTIDFNDHTYTANEGVGSTGTETLGFQILKNNTVTLKGGTFVAGEGILMLVQNYASLNVVDMNLDGTSEAVQYVLSNNSGTVNISGATNITASANGVAFDVYDYTSAGYPVPTVNVATTGTITGKIEVSTSIANNLTITGGTYTVNVDAYCADGYACNKDGENYKVAKSNVAKIGTTEYLTLAQAVAAATDGQKVELLRSVENGAGVVIDKNITIDFNGKTYKFKSGVGSTGTESNGFQILKENTVTLQNGALEVNEIFSHNFYILVQNYANLTVNNMKLDGTYLDKWSKVETDQDSYVLSNNSGTVNIIGATNITANNDGNKAFAFDVCDKQPYANPVVTVKTTGKISGNIEVSEGLTDNLHIQGGTYTLDVQTWCDEGYFSFANDDNTLWTVSGPYVAKIEDENGNETYYATLQAAVDAADGDDDVVVLVADATGSGVVINKNVTIDFNDHTYTANEGVGSTGTETLGFQILKNNTVTLKGGTFVAGEGILMLVQNYASLNVVDMNLDGTSEAVQYVLSNNSGTVNISGATNITASANGVAFDVCKYASYAVPTVNVETTGTITGAIEVSEAIKYNLNISAGTFTNEIMKDWCHKAYVPTQNADATWTVRLGNFVAEVKDQVKARYETIAEAIARANNEEGAQTINVLADNTTSTSAVVTNDLTLNLNGKAITAVEDIYPVIRIQNNANVTITGNGSITNADDYVFVLGDANIEKSGYLTIENGTFLGGTTVASVTKGNLTINGGDFSVNPYQGNYAYLINCYDASYKNGTATVAIKGGTFHNWNPENNAAEGEGTNFCAAGYAAKETSSNVWTVVSAQRHMLANGWNWYSSYIASDNLFEQLKNELATSCIQIKNHETYYNGSIDNWVGNLNAISVKEMYMIKLNKDEDIFTEGPIANPAEQKIEICKKWNWIGYPMTEAMSVKEALADLKANDGDIIKAHNGAFTTFIDGYGWVEIPGASNILNSMEPGNGYMYYSYADVNKAFNYSYPTSTSRSAAKANVTAENNHWVANASAFANNMTIVAALNVEGVEMGEGVEVAAFVNGEVRGSARPFYVESIDSYVMFLSVYGNDQEEVTFKYIDLYTEEEYTLNNKVAYADNAIIGSIAEPMTLCYGTMGIGENAANTISLYPNPTTTNAAISFETVCDVVEVFNSLGVRVAEYRNVDSIDGLEAAGVYVIRVTNGETVQNCRLIVK